MKYHKVPGRAEIVESRTPAEPKRVLALHSLWSCMDSTSGHCGSNEGRLHTTWSVSHSLEKDGSLANSRTTAHCHKALEQAEEQRGGEERWGEREGERGLIGVHVEQIVEKDSSPAPHTETRPGNGSCLSSGCREAAAANVGSVNVCSQPDGGRALMQALRLAGRSDTGLGWAAHAHRVITVSLISKDTYGQD